MIYFRDTKLYFRRSHSFCSFLLKFKRLRTATFRYDQAVRPDDIGSSDSYRCKNYSSGIKEC